MTGTASARQRMLVIASCAVILALYAIAAWNSDFIYDDRLLVLEQAPPRDLGEVLSVFGERHWYNLPYYRPVSRVTMVGQKYLHGDVPRPFHMFNAVLMGIAALLAYAMLRRPVFRVRFLPALIGSALFALHPIASSTVYPICSGRESLLPAVLILASMYCYLRRGTAWRAAAMIGFAAALLAKEQAVVLPLLFVLADVLGLPERKPGRRGAFEWCVRYLPVVVILVGYLVVRLQLFGGAGEHTLAALSRPAGPVQSLMYALQTAFIPFADLVYEPRFEIWISWWRQLLALSAVVGVAIAWPRSISRLRKPVLFWTGWFVGGLLPTANLLAQDTRFAERYVFLSLLGVVGIAAALVSDAWESRWARQAGIAAGAGLLILCALLSFQRGRFFADDLAFHTQWIATDAQSFQGHISLGEYYFETGDLERAERHSLRALQIRPASAAPHNTLGHVLAWKGDPAGAVEHYETSLRLDPSYAKTHSSLSLALALQGDFVAAEEQARRALALEPGLPGARFNLGYVLEQAGKSEEAVSEYARETGLGARALADAHVGVARQFAAQGRFRQTVAHLDRALAADPGHAEARAAVEQIRSRIGR